MRIHYTTERTEKEEKISYEHEKAEAYRNEIKSYIVRAGMTMTEVVDYLADEYGWSASIPNLSDKLRRPLSAIVKLLSWLTRWVMTLFGRNGSSKTK